MRIFIGSSREQVRLVEWLTAYMRREYPGVLDPVPWTVPWPGGHYTLENLLRFVDQTDAAILFWTAEDRTWYRDTVRYEPRDNLVFEAGLFMAAHGRERAQLMVPQYKSGDERGTVALPTDVTGLTCNLYEWADTEPQTTGLPLAARQVCDFLRNLKPRARTPMPLLSLAGRQDIEEIRTFVGAWSTLHTDGIQRLAGDPNAQSIDILAAYRVGEVRRILESNWKPRKGARVRACFANMWDDALVETYRRKYHDRTAEHIRQALNESLRFILGPCEINIDGGRVSVAKVDDPPKADYKVRLTSQRITYSFYRIDEVIFLVPLDMKRAQNPAPLAWALAKDTAPLAFEHYLREFDIMFDEASPVFPAA